MLGFQWLPIREWGWVVLCFRPALVTLCSGPSLAPRFAGFTIPARQSQWETVISCAGGQVFLVRLGGTSSAMRAVPVAAVCNEKVRSSISISVWLRMPWSRGCLLSVTERSVLCPLSFVHSCCCSVSSLEELAVIRVDGCGCGSRAHPCEATASGLLSLGSSPPSPGRVGGVAGPGLPGLLAWTFHRFRLGDWSSDHASSSVASRPSPSHGLARLGVHVCLSTFGLLSFLFPGNIRLQFLGISRSFFR